MAVGNVPVGHVQRASSAVRGAVFPLLKIVIGSADELDVIGVFGHTIAARLRLHPCNANHEEE